MYSSLFQEACIGSLNLKNRIIMAPMATIAAADGSFSDTTCAYLTARAKGGVGLIVSGAQMINDFFGKPGSGSFYLPEHAAKASLLATDIHSYGAKFCLEFGYGNGRCGCNDPGNPPYSASPVPTMQHPEVLCRELPKQAIQQLVADTGKAAKLAQDNGVDAVMLHAYAGYLLDQFQSAQWNQRTDEYGGSFANRLRFTTELIAAIKAACGADFPVLVKVSVSHGTPEGRQLSEGIEICRQLEAAGADALLIDSGSFETRWNRCIPTVYEEECFSLPQAAEVKQAVGIPVIAQNKISDPDNAVQALDEGKCDFIALGHALLTDSEWANKAHRELVEEIRPCIGCNECFRCIATGQVYACAVNPVLSHERELPYCPKPVKLPCNLLVIGGGPAGVCAALVAAERGASVQLWETGPQIGGNLRAAAVPGFKKDIQRYLDYLNKQLETSSAKVFLNKRATVENVLAENFTQVIVACGAKPKQLPIPGIEGRQVCTAVDYLLGETKPGKSVAVIGGGLVGCETALYAEQQGAEVTILEALPQLLQTAQEARNNHLALLQLLAQSRVKTICEAEVLEITAKGLRYRKDGQEQLLPCDKVIQSTGFEAKCDLPDRLQAAGLNVITVGDSVQPRKVIDAVHEGFEAAVFKL